VVPVRRREGVLVRQALYKRALAAIDLAAGAAALTLGGVTAAHGHVTVGAMLTLPLIVLTAQLSGLYHRDEHLLHKTTLEEAPAMFQVAALYSLLTWLLSDATWGGELRPSQVVVIWALLFGFMLIGRALGRWAVRQISPAERCLVLGDAGSAASIQRKLELSFSLKAVVVGRIAFGDEPESCPDGMSPPVLGGVPELVDTLSRHEVDRVIVVPNDPDDALEAIRAVTTLGVPLSVLPRMLEAIGSSFEFDDVDGVTLLGIRSSQLTRSSWVLKRSMDLTLAALGLVVLAPLLAVVAFAIKVTSPGPVLYRQRRIGRDGLEFDMFKFRSMVDGADAQKPSLLELNETQGLFKIADDPRTTPVGRFLRRSSLDELPQLWNVVRGEMSLVGPRPLVPDDDAKIEGWRRKRLNIKPGITGPWQILGSTRSPLEEMVKLDYLYGATWSLWLDAKIMLRTLIYMASRRSA
jgi:exopolysaccharide biosynthesis polyprenyl glycosylphosphotransferase